MIDISVIKFNTPPQLFVFTSVLQLQAQFARKSKKVQAKKLVKSNKSIPQNFILTKFHFLQFQNWPKIYF